MHDARHMNTPQSNVPAAARAAAEAAAEEFIEGMGLTAEADGLPRIAGRMWGLFVIEGGPCSFAELAERLQVSRGSISTNARLLRDFGILERVSRPGDRQDYYRLAENPYGALLHGYADRMRAKQRNAERAISALPLQHMPGVRQRLESMQQFHQSAVEATEALITKLRDPAHPHQQDDQ